MQKNNYRILPIELTRTSLRWKLYARLHHSAIEWIDVHVDVYPRSVPQAAAQRGHKLS
jgi:hypothetical protein